MTYCINKNLFCELFNINDITYNYIKETTYQGKQSLSELLNDPYLTDEQKEIVQKTMTS